MPSDQPDTPDELSEVFGFQILFMSSELNGSKTGEPSSTPWSTECPVLTGFSWFQNSNAPAEFHPADEGLRPHKPADVGCCGCC